MKQWSLFGISIGFLLVLLSSTLTNGLSVMVTGLTLIIGFGFLFFKRKDK